MAMRSLTTLAAFLTLGVSALAEPNVPRTAKEFDFVDTNGQHSLLSSYKGKVVLIQFLLTTCPHCQAMSQMLTKLQTELGPKGFQAVGVVYNEPDPGSRITQADMGRNYSAQFHLNFPVSYAPRPTVLSFIEASVMDRLMFPHVVVVDKTGKVRAESKIEGTADLQNEAYLTNFIGGLLKEGAASSSTVTKKAPAVAANATK